MNDGYNYLDILEDPDDEELSEIENIFHPDKLKTDVFDSISSDIDKEENDCIMEFSRSENGFKIVTGVLQKNENIKVGLPDIVKNKRILFQLQEHGIYNTEDILRRTRREIESLKFIGIKGTNNIAFELHNNGLFFSDEELCKCNNCSIEFISYNTHRKSSLCPVCQLLSEGKTNTFDYSIYSCDNVKKDFKALYKYIDLYVYDMESEEIMIRNSPNAICAFNAYQTIVEKYSLTDNKRLKWCFDIALNCTRELNCNDKEYLKQEYNMDFFSIGLHVRNKYVYCAKVHRVFRGFADTISGIVLGLMSTICHSYYNYFNVQLCKLLNNYDYADIKKVYGKQFSFIHDYTMFLTCPECTLQAEDVLKAIIQQLRNTLGKDGFKNILIDSANKIQGDLLAHKNWINLLNLLHDNGCSIYRKEYNQLKALKEIHFFINEYNSINQIKESIISELGLIDSDAQYMAECIWIAFKDRINGGLN